MKKPRRSSRRGPQGTALPGRPERPVIWKPWPSLWEEAADDPRLERMLTEIDEAMFQEIGGKPSSLSERLARPRRPLGRLERRVRHSGGRLPAGLSRVAAARLPKITAPVPRQASGEQRSRTDRPTSPATSLPYSRRDETRTNRQRPDLSGRSRTCYPPRLLSICLTESGEGKRLRLTQFVRTFNQVRCCSCCAHFLWR